MPAPPTKAPETNVGSFEILDDGSVYIYWKKINKSDENGPEFGYSITEVSQNGTTM